MTNYTDEAAALEEGLAPMPSELIDLRNEMLTLNEQIDMLTARKDEIKNTFGDALDSAGLKGFLLHGKVHARVKSGTRTTVDSKKLKTDMPHIWEKFMRVTAYRSITVD